MNGKHFGWYTTISIGIWGFVDKTKSKVMRTYVQSGQYHSIVEICKGSWSLISGIKVMPFTLTRVPVPGSHSLWSVVS